MSRTNTISELKNDVVINLLKVFKNREHYLNYDIKGYKVDIYFPSYNLAVHGINIMDPNNNNTQVALMNKTLRKGLSFRFIEFNVLKPNFDIFELIGSILSYMDTYERLSSTYIMSSGRIENILQTNNAILNEIIGIKQEFQVSRLNIENIL